MEANTKVPTSEKNSQDLLVAEYGVIKNLITNIYPTGICSIVCDSFDYWAAITIIAKKLKAAIMARDGKVVFRPDTGDPVRVVCGDPIKEYFDGDYIKSLKDATLWAKDELEEHVRNDTPHGECGEGNPSSYFKYNGVAYKLVLDIFWNRHDKEYYYIDGCNIESCEEAILSHEEKGSIECLWGIFGGTVSEQGYKVLDSHVGLIYGDSITFERAEQICEGLKNKGFASTNIVFGIGSFTYQYVTRDTDCYAVKATFARVAGKDINVYKKPKTGDGTKNSALGLTAVLRNQEGELHLKDSVTFEEMMNCELKEVFRDGKLLVDQTLAEIRDRIKNQ